MGRPGEGRDLSVAWLEELKIDTKAVPNAGTPIEKKLLEAIRAAGRLPEPLAQYSIFGDSGELLTIPDFAFLDRRIAVYCDGFAYHGDKETLESDARKRNALQAKGWAVLTFWGRQILRDAAACERQIWQCYQFRNSFVAEKRAA
jgi:G:T-mismatch repair DNA endonuclease (very short patch repair protein)